MVPTTVQNLFSLTYPQLFRKYKKKMKMNSENSENESFSLTNLFTQNTNVGLQLH